MDEYRVGEYSKDDAGKYYSNTSIDDDESLLVCDRCECKVYEIHTDGWGYAIKCTKCGLISHIGE